MKKQIRLHLLLASMICLFVLSACDQSKEIAVTFTEKECTYTGPTTISSPQISVNWIIRDPSHTSYILGFVQLEQGKTVNDLAAFREGEDDSWIRVISLHPAIDAGSQFIETDLSQSALFQNGPVYIACVNDPDIGPFDAIGPINVLP